MVQTLLQSASVRGECASYHQKLPINEFLSFFLCESAIIIAKLYAISRYQESVADLCKTIILGKIIIEHSVFKKSDRSPSIIVC